MYDEKRFYKMGYFRYRGGVVFPRGVVNAAVKDNLPSGNYKYVFAWTVTAGGYRSVLDPQSNYYGRITGSGGAGGTYTTADGCVTFTLTSGYTYKVNVPVTVWLADGSGTYYPANTEFTVSLGGIGQYDASILITVS